MEALEVDLGRFATVESLEERLQEVKAGIAEMDAEYGTRSIKGTEDEPRWDELNAELEAIEKRLRELAVRRQRVAAAAAAGVAEDGDGAVQDRAVHVAKSNWTRDTGEIRAAARSQEEYRQKLHDSAMHFVEQDTFAHPDADQARAKAHVERLLNSVQGPLDSDDPGVGREKLARRILFTGSPLYRKAFGKHLAGQPMTPDEQRAFTMGSSSAGQAVVYTLDPTVVPTSNSSVNPWRALARVEQISGTNEWKALTSGAITAAYGAEALETTDNTPTLAQPDIIAEKAQAFVAYSIESGEDWTRLESEMASLLQDAKDDLEATKFATGAGHGSTEPKGVITGATNTVGTTTTAAFVIADVYKLFEALPARFRPRAEFAANLFVIDKIRQFDTSGGSGVWIGPQGLQAQAAAGDNGARDPGVRVPLLGRGVYESTAMGAALTTTTKILLVGDFRYFVIVDRVGLNIETIPHLFGTAANFPTGQRGLYAYWRNSSDVLSAAAFRVLVT